MNKTTILAGALAVSLLCTGWLAFQLYSNANPTDEKQTIQQQNSEPDELHTDLGVASSTMPQDTTTSTPTSSSVPMNNKSSSSSALEETEDSVPTYGYKQINGLVDRNEVTDSQYEGKLTVSVGDSGLEFATKSDLEGHISVESRTTDLPDAAPDYNEIKTYDIIVDDYVMGNLFIIHMDYVLSLDKLIGIRAQRVMDMDNVFTVAYVEYGNVPEELVTNYVQSMTVRELSREIRETIRIKK